MHTQKKELDRTFFKTHQSRSVKFSPNINTGFTLIELLVVISIIALLSTIVLAVIQDGRVKARNTAKNSLVLEYVKALELHRSNNGSYPIAPTTPPTCVGYEETPSNTSDNCFFNAYNGLNSLNSAFSIYIKGDFAHKGAVMNGSSNLNGIQYICIDSMCTSYKLIWILEKQISNCISSVESIPYLGHIRCEYLKQ